MTYCCLSLDDDDVDYWKNVSAAVEPYGAKITCFPTVSKITPVEWNVLRVMSQKGHEISVHCMTHIPLIVDNRNKWAHEVIDAARSIEFWVGSFPTSHAIPYGQTSPELREWLKTTGLLGARAVGHRIQPLAEIDPFDVPVMDREWLKGDGSEVDVRRLTKSMLQECQRQNAPFMFYSHNVNNMTVNQIRWVVDELHQAGERFITFSEFARHLCAVKS